MMPSGLDGLGQSGGRSFHRRWARQVVIARGATATRLRRAGAPRGPDPTSRPLAAAAASKSSLSFRTKPHAAWFYRPSEIGSCELGTRN